MYEIEKYYVWKDDDHADADGFYDYDEAYKYALGGEDHFIGGITFKI